MGRLLSMVLLALVGWLLWRSWATRDQRGLKTGQQDPGSTRPGPQALGEPMVSCAQCGMHIPRSEALLQGSLSYCSREHLLAARQDLPG